MPWWGRLDDAHHPHFSKKRVPGYWILFLLLETGVLGTFCALDFFLFYIFWEVMLLPMYFLIGIWGAPPRVEEGGRVRGGPYAAIKFFLYTLAGSVLMLLAHDRHLLPLRAGQAGRRHAHRAHLQHART